MTASEFINTYAFATVAAFTKKPHPTKSNLKEAYFEKYFYLPRLKCKDGFSISIQVHRGSYCASEKGIREFGLLWQEVEWGFPSELISGKEFNAEEEGTTGTVGGYVDVKVIDNLLEEHGGLDLIATLKNGIYDVQR